MQAMVEDLKKMLAEVQELDSEGTFEDDETGRLELLCKTAKHVVLIGCVTVVCLTAIVGAYLPAVLKALFE